MPIDNVRPQLTERVRIRTGVKKPGKKQGETYPSALPTFRFTSADRGLIERAAEAFGGELAEWAEPKAIPAKQWEVVTEASRIEVYLPPIPGGFSQWNERWSGGGCIRRCDGNVDRINGVVCDCPDDVEVRRAAAQRGEACKPTSRLTVIVPALGDLVGARLESHSWWTAVELAGTAKVFYEIACRQVMFVPGVLSIDERQGAKREGQPTRRYRVASFTTSLSTAVAIAPVAGQQAALEPPKPRELPPAPAHDQPVGWDESEDLEDELDGSFATAVAEYEALDADARHDLLSTAAKSKAGLSGDDELADFVRLITAGRTANLGQLGGRDIYFGLRCLDHLDRGTLDLGLVEGGGFRWRTTDGEPAVVTFARDGTVGVQGEGGSIDWRRRCDGSTVSLAALLRKARELAKAGGHPEPANLDDEAMNAVAGPLGLFIDANRAKAS